jgi:hypothetical protein
MNTIFKQLHHSLIHSKGQRYDFVDEKAQIIDLGTKVTLMANERIYGISRAFFEYKVPDLIFLANTVLNN